MVFHSKFQKLVYRDIYMTIAPTAAAMMAITPTLVAWVLAALPVDVGLAAEVEAELAALEAEEVVVVIETAGELVGAAVIKVPPV